MAITKADLLTDIASDLSDFGEWSEADGSYLERQLFKAVDDVWKAYQWAFRISSTSLTVTAGTLGSYPLSGSLPVDFGGLVSEEKIGKYFAYDAYGVSPPIPDGSQGQRYPVVLERASAKIRFLVDPGTGTRTLYYLVKLTDIDAALALFPDDVALKKILAARTGHYALVNTEDFAAQAKTFWEQSKLLLIEEIRSQRKMSSRPDTRNTQDVNGNPIYYGFQAGSEA